MPFTMMLFAKPGNLQGLAIVVMVHFGIRITAHLARFALQLAALQVNMGIGPAIHFPPLFLGERMIPAIESHADRAAFPALPRGVWIHRVTACVASLHGRSVPHKHCIAMVE